jgi:hypothetical protein
MISKSHFWWGPLRDPHETYLRLLGAATPRPRSVAPQLVAESHRQCTDRGCLVVGTTTAVADFLLDYTHSPRVHLGECNEFLCCALCSQGSLLCPQCSCARNAPVPSMLLCPQSSCALNPPVPRSACALNGPAPSILRCPQSSCLQCSCTLNPHVAPMLPCPQCS